MILGEKIRDAAEEQKQAYRNKQLIDELSKMPPMVLGTAYLYALNCTRYGVDVTKEWETIAQNVSALEKAYNEGYCDALQRRAESGMAVKALEQQPCEDCISRADVKKYLSAPDANGDRVIYESDLDLLPSVTPQQKTGRWIESKGYDDRDHFYTCSECGRGINLICGAKLSEYPYCHCGAKMIGESEDSAGSV